MNSLSHDFSTFDLPADVYSDGIGIVENLGDNFTSVYSFILSIGGLL
jgi:hypothetical protein